MLGPTESSVNTMRTAVISNIALFTARDMRYLNSRSPTWVLWVLCFTLFSATAVPQVSAQAIQPAPPIITTVNDAAVEPPPRLHAFSGLPLTENGWTDLDWLIRSPAYADARVVYVSASGNDATGQVYQPNHQALGGRPLNPPGQVAAFRTLDAAYARLRQGYPDVMLLRRGDSWTSSLRVSKAGRNSSEPMIIGAYGPEVLARPMVRHVHTDNGARYIFVGSVHNRLTGTSSEHLRGDRVIYEDVFWESPFGTTGEVIAAMLNGGDRNTIGGGMIRRSAASWTVFFAGNWGGSPQTPSRFEENTISRSGLGTGKSNVYFSEGARNIQSIRNQSLLTGNAGFRQRGGGIVRETLTLGVQPGLNWGGGFDVHNELIFENNLGMHFRGPHDFTGLRSARITGNIFTAFDSPEQGAAFLRADYQGVHGGWQGNIVFEGNIYRTANFVFGYEGLPSALAANATVTFRNETMIKTNGGTVLATLNDGRVRYENNRYFSDTPNANLFSGRSYDQMIPSTGQVVGSDTWPDPERNILTYMRSLGANPANVQQAIEWYSDGVPGNASLAGALANRRGAWDERFTAIAVINHIREGFGLPPL